MFDFTHYNNICAATAADDNLFKNFRQQQTFFDMYEHVTYEQGLVYIDEIEKNLPSLFMFMDDFVTNDNVGNPVKHYYEKIDMNIAPTTLRYVKVLSDLINQFGHLNGMNIVEIGVGYGGQCKVIKDFFNIKSYTMVDLPNVVALAKRYLAEFNMEANAIDGPWDLLISNYAFSEIERGYQDFYTERFLKQSKRGYMTYNFYRENRGELTFSEITGLIPGAVMLEEKPKTDRDNFIYIWDHK